MQSATITTTAAFVSAVLTTSSVLAAGPADKEVREADKGRDNNEETESGKGTRKDREQLEAEQGSCGSD